MAKLAIKKASTDVTTYVFIQDSSKTTGEGLTGLAYNTGSLVGYYVRPKGSATAITLATQTVTGDHSDGGFVEVDATNMPGVYRLDLPDAVCATGVPSVVVMLKGATNMSPVVLEIQLTDFDLNTAAITVDGIADAVWDEAISGHTTGTTFGGKNQKVVPSETINDYKADVSALTNVTLANTQGAITWGQQKIVADADGEGALDIVNTGSGGGGVGIHTEGQFAGQLNEGTGGSSNGTYNIGTACGLLNYGATGQYNNGSDYGVFNNGSVKAVEGYDPAIATASNLQTVDDNVDAILADTGTDGVVLKAAGLNADAVTKIQSGLALEATLTAIKGAGWTTQQTLSYIANNMTTEGFFYDMSSAIYKIQNDLENGGRLDLLIDSIIAHLVAIKGAGWTNQTLVKIVTDLATVDTVVDAIKVQTDKIPATPASAGEYTANIGAIKAKTDNLPLSPASSGEYTSALTAIQNDLDNPNQYKADVSNLALQATSLAIKGQTDKIPAAPAQTGEYNAALTAIQSDLDNPAQYKADVSGLATTTDMSDLKDRIDAVDTIADAILEDTGTTIPAALATIAGYTDGIAGDVWSYAKRTLTHPSVSAEEPEDSNTLILYRDADIAIELTDLTIPAGAKKYIFTIKDNLDGGDDQAVLQASYAIDGSEVETNTLVYINSAVPPALTNPVTFTLTETNITIDLTAEAAALLPRYERGYLNWDLKLVTDAAVTIVLQGLAQIIGTSTRAIE